MSNGVGAIDKAYVWPQYVRDRVRDTYMYFGGSLVVTAASAAMVLRSPAMLRLMTRNSFLVSTNLQHHFSIIFLKIFFETGLFTHLLYK